MLDSYHPIALFCYFTSVIVLSMFISNPLFMLISIILSLCFYLTISKANVKSGLYNLVLIILITITNPLFNHNGVTKLFYINDNAITLEALLYGLNIGIMIIAILYWFKCISIIMTQDKILYLFGKISPKLCVLISNSLRFVSLLKRQSEKVKNTQKVMGMYCGDNYLDRLKSNMRAFSSVTSFGLENAISMGMSMDARGYGLKGRTYYHSYKFKISDIILLVTTIIADAIIIIAKINGSLDFNFYPSIKYCNIDTLTISSTIAFMLLLAMPTLINIKEGLKWKYLESKI